MKTRKKFHDCYAIKDHRILQTLQRVLPNVNCTASCRLAFPIILRRIRFHNLEESLVENLETAVAAYLKILAHVSVKAPHSLRLRQEDGSNLEDCPDVLTSTALKASRREISFSAC